MPRDTAIARVAGRGVCVPGADIDTDRIIPARFMKSVTFEGLGAHAFHDARFGPGGETLDHPFNDPRNAGARILVVGRNFGCGSSREHAPQALLRWGIRAIVGESFAEIFAGNCAAIGLPAVSLEAPEAAELARLAAQPETEIVVDLRDSRVSAGGRSWTSRMPEAARRALLEGTWDTTATLLENLAAIHRTAERLPYLRGFGG